jgi:hypothetical protein
LIPLILTLITYIIDIDDIIDDIDLGNWIKSSQLIFLHPRMVLAHNYQGK